MKEWLPSIESRKKWQNQLEDMKENYFVLIVNTKRKVTIWESVRNVLWNRWTGKSSGNSSWKYTTLKRPITKLCPLECS